MIWVLLVLCSLLILFFIFNTLKKRSFVKLFDKGNVQISGMKGRGKDVAFCIVVNARKKDYISNVQYSDPKKNYHRFEFDTKVWELSGNSYTDLISNTPKSYVYPYPDDIDYYISDAGIYYPAQYATQLCKRYESSPFFLALSRHLGNCNVHTNTQAYNRLWDKIREQGDIYLYMKSCRFIPKTKICLLSCYEYERAEAVEAHIIPPKFGIGKEAKSARYNFEIAHGKIKHRWFFAKLPYRYDSRRFKRLLENNLKDYENE